jgi:hypothetical protein
MPSVELSYWHDGHNPGDVVEVSDEELAALTRDGRVARVVEDPDPAAEAAPVPEADPATAAQPQPQPSAEAPASEGRARKAR